MKIGTHLARKDDMIRTKGSSTGTAVQEGHEGGGNPCILSLLFDPGRFSKLQEGTGINLPTISFGIGM